MSVISIIGIVLVLVGLCLTVLYFPPMQFIKRLNTDSTTPDFFAQFVDHATQVLHSLDTFVELDIKDVRRYLLAAWYWFVMVDESGISQKYREVFTTAYWNMSNEMREEAYAAYSGIKNLARNYVIARITGLLTQFPDSPELLKEALDQIANRNTYEQTIAEKQLTVSRSK